MIVGDKALDALETVPKQVITETKRQMENDVVYSVDEGKWVDKDEKNKDYYSPAQISSFIFISICCLNIFLGIYQFAIPKCKQPKLGYRILFREIPVRPE